MYAIDPKYAQKYKQQFNIPDIVIQRAAKKGSPIYVLKNPQVKVLKISSYIEKEETPYERKS